MSQTASPPFLILILVDNQYDDINQEVFKKNLWGYLSMIILILFQIYT